MGREIEIKLRLTSHGPAIAALRAAGAEFVSSEDEVNTLFDTPDASLRTSSRALRIRLATDRTTGIVTCTLTFKGPRDPAASGVKSRAEHEVQVSDAAEARALLAGLGYVPTLQFEKRRDTWRLGPAKVVLDLVPSLGHFLEVEAPDEATVIDTVRKLGLENEPIEKRSYAALVAGTEG